MTCTLKKLISASEFIGVPDILRALPCYIEKQQWKGFIYATPLYELKVADAKYYNNNLVDFALFLSAYTLHIEHLLL